MTENWSYGRILSLNSAMASVQLFYAISGLLLNAYLTGALGLRPAVVSGLNVVGPICGFFVQPLVGMLSDMTTLRCGPRRPYIVAGSLLTSVSYALFVTSTLISVDSLSVRRALCITGMVLANAGMNMVLGPFRALNNEVLPPETRDKGNAFASTILGGVFGLLNMVFAGVSAGVWGRTLPSNAASTPEFKTMFMVVSLVGLVTAVVFIVPTWICAKEKRIESTGASFGHRVRSLAGSFRNVSRELTMVFLCVFLGNAGSFSVQMFLSTDECLGVYIGSVSTAVSCIGGLFFSLAMPHLIKKTPVPLWLVSQIVAVPAFLILCFTPQIAAEKDIVDFLRKDWWCMIISILIGINQSALYSLPFICIGRGLARGISQGSVCSMVNMVLVLGQAVGLLTQTALYSMVTKYQAPFVTCSIFSVLNLVAIAFLPACHAAPEESLLEAEDKIEE